MTPRKVPSSYQMIDLVREAIGTKFVRASDTDVANALGITRAAVYGYKSGKEYMSMETLGRAAEIAEIGGPRLAMIQVGIMTDKAKGPGERRVLDAVWESLTKSPIPSILLAVTALFGASPDARASVKPVFSAQVPAPAQFASNVYYVKS
jgi:hypothetical protein